MTNVLYVDDELLVVDVSGAMNGNQVGTHSVTIDEDNMKGLKSFQFVNKYTGETYDNDFRAYDSVYEIGYEALDDGYLVIDWATKADTRIRFYAGENTTNDREDTIVIDEDIVNVYTEALNANAPAAFTFNSVDEDLVDSANNAYEVVGNNIVIAVVVDPTVASFEWTVTADNIQRDRGTWNASTDPMSITTERSNLTDGSTFVVNVTNIKYKTATAADVNAALNSVPNAVVEITEAPAAPMTGVTVPDGAKLVIAATAAGTDGTALEGSSVTVEPTGTVEFGGKTYVGEGGLTSDADITLTVLAGNHMRYTLNGNATLGDNAVLELTDDDELYGAYYLSGGENATIKVWNAKAVADNWAWKIAQSSDGTANGTDYDPATLSGGYTYIWDSDNTRWNWTNSVS